MKGGLEMGQSCLTVKDLKEQLNDKSKFHDDSLALVFIQSEDTYKPILGVISASDDYSAIIMLGENK
jgi:hypothetical protein